MRRRTESPGPGGVPARLARFDPAAWPAETYGDALRLWIEAWDQWQGGGSRGVAVRFRAEADAWARYPDEPWDPSLI